MDDPLVLLMERNKELRQFRKLCDREKPLKRGYHYYCSTCAEAEDAQLLCSKVLCSNQSSCCSCRHSKAIVPDTERRFVSKTDLIFFEAERLTGCSSRGEMFFTFGNGQELYVVEAHHCDVCDTRIGMKYVRRIQHDGREMVMQHHNRMMVATAGPFAPYFMMPRSSLRLVEVPVPLPEAEVQNGPDEAEVQGGPEEVVG